MARLGLRRGGIGVDVGTSAVRAAEVRGGRTAVVARFGQVLLPRGAVRDGQVADPEAVGQALATLWRRAGFGSRTVRVGVAHPRDVVLRQLELPSMPREELEGAIRFQEELIPIPLAEAVMDFEVVEEYTAADGRPTMRVMVAAAQRWMIDRLLEALGAARLEAEAIEPHAYALVRSLGTEAALGTAEAIVDVGASVSNVVVHEAGRLRFVRMLDAGGDDLTKALAEATGLEWDAAEALKYRASGLQPEAEEEGEESEDLERAAGLLGPRIDSFAREVAVSLGQYTSLPDSAPLGRVLVTGGGSLVGGLVERMADALRMEVERGRAFSKVTVGKVRLEPEQVAAAEPFLAVAVGLALGALEG